jgi:uncharacterized membrane protein YphA (DoxX/SURF4 family)
MIVTPRLSLWNQFWHEPVRAERLALTRICLGLALLTDQLFQYWPQFEVFYGPEGVAPAGVHDEWLLSVWRWTILVFNTDHLTVLHIAFWLRVAVTTAFVLGWHTRVMSVLLWFMTLCFINRNPALRNGADDVLMVGLFWMMFAPSGQALSLDRRRELRKLGPAAPDPPLTPAWPLRILQIQLCMIYLSTGLAKLVRVHEPFVGTWWEGTSLHYVLNDTTMGRRSFAALPLPFWLTAAGTYFSVGWEILFTPLVMMPWTRKWNLWFGVFFHLGIYLTIEVGWFGLYTTSLYALWTSDGFWERWRHRDKKAEGHQEIEARNGQVQTKALIPDS